MYRLLACLLFATSLPAMAQIYEYTDANGNKAFTNQPPPTGVNATPVELQPTNGANVPDFPPPAAPAPAASGNQQQTSNSNATTEDQHYTTDDGYDYYNNPGPAGPAGVDAVGADPGRGRAGTPRVDPVGADPGRGTAGSAAGDAVGADPGPGRAGGAGRGR